MKNPSSILITGATSGLGRAIAFAYARAGVHLYLTGRHEGRLADTARTCRQKGAEVSTKIVDVIDGRQFADWVDTIYAGGGRIDMVIANAGISAGTGGGNEAVEQVRNIFATNIDGVINTIHPVIEYMRQEKSGQVVIISSLAGYRGMPGAPAYSASKAAVRVYGEGLRGSLAKDGIGVTVVTPGYIKTPMTAVNNFPMPFIMTAPQAANIIVKRLQHNPARIAFPLPLYIVIWLLYVTPQCWSDWLLRRMPEKKSS